MQAALARDAALQGAAARAGATDTGQRALRDPAEPPCAHCGLPVPQPAARFCCPGCEAAFAAITQLGLGQYYQRRVREASARALRPDPQGAASLLAGLPRHVRAHADGSCDIELALEGMSCGACVWLIESVLRADPSVLRARVNLTTRRLLLRYRGTPQDAPALAGKVLALGYQIAAYDPSLAQQAQDESQQTLIRAMAVAGFAAANIMLLSLGAWFGESRAMGPGTRDLLHWISALIALPAIAYAGQPFFRSALAALRAGHTNMDVPISLGVLIVTGVSLAETHAGSAHAYFDSAVTLLFFLLIGRVLDHRARGAARAAAAHLLMLRASTVLRIAADGTAEPIAAAALAAGDRLLVPMGERIGADGVIETGTTALDTSALTGESAPAEAGPGVAVFAGTRNLGAPITVLVRAVGEATLLAECQRLIDAAEHARGRFVGLADRIARAYAPAVHLTALISFLGWHVWAGAPLAQSLRIAAAVLIVTCPCALALAVPAVQVIVTSGLMRRRILLKSPSALERLAGVDHVVFDKTGTLTNPSPVLDGASAAALLANADAMRLVAGLATVSRHPLARALAAALPAAPALAGAREMPGQGVVWQGPAGEVRLGSAAFCGLGAAEAEASGPGGPAAQPGPVMLLSRPGLAPVVLRFAEVLRPGAAAAVAALRAGGIGVSLLSGDQGPAVARIAAELGIEDHAARLSPPQKLAALQDLRARGAHVLMVGDGLNDAPALAAAHVSCAPASAADVAQTLADVVIEGDSLAPLACLLPAARQARRAILQNLVLALAYNAVMVPLAVGGFVTPWLAAIAMSGSSLLVMGNALRAGVVRTGAVRTGAPRTGTLGTGMLPAGILRKGNA